MNTRKGNRRHNINHCFFKEWSPDMAYILGLWWADGCVCGNRVKISLHKDDKYLLEKISEIMDSDYVLYRNHDNYEFSFSSKEISSDIKRLGGMERKSLDILMPSVPDDFLSHFVRGLFDGDGSVWNSHSGNILCNILTGSPAMFDGLCNSLSEFGIKHNKSIRKTSSGSYRHDILFSGNKAKLFRDFIYKDCGELYMRRKRKLFDSSGDLIEKPTFETSREIARKSGCKTAKEWVKYKKDNRIKNALARPDRETEKWMGWDDFLGVSKERGIDKFGHIVWRYT